MKKLMFLMLAGSLSLVGCKKEGCMDSKATNYDEKAKKDDGSCILPVVEPVVIDPTDPTSDTENPVVVISTPTKATKVKAGDVVKISVTVTDNGAGATWSYTIADPEKKVIETENRNLTGATSETVTGEYTIGADPAGGLYKLSVTATDAAGNVSATETVEFTVETASTNDTKAPTINAPVKTFPVAGTSIASGTKTSSGGEWTFSVDDDVEVDMVTIYLYNTTDGENIATKEIKDIGKAAWSEKIKLTFDNAHAGDEAILKIIATDKAGNETKLDGTVTYSLTRG